MWQLKIDTGHMTCDMWLGANILLKLQIPSSYGFEGLEETSNIYCSSHNRRLCFTTLLGKTASAFWGKGAVQIWNSQMCWVQIWDSPKGTPQIAEDVIPNFVVKPIRLISIVGLTEHPKQLDIQKEATITWSTIKWGFTKTS